jgi:Family of unknown function (DUF6789)
MDTRRRLRRGLQAGLLATVLMTVLMLAGKASGLSPIPRPIPVALMAWVLRGAVPRLVLLALGLLAHLAYGAAAGALFSAVLGRRAQLWTGLAWGALLWLAMGLFWLPLLHWGRFGASVQPGIALATLVLHLAYGAVLGWWVGRGAAAESAE